ncbi:MAG: hypothetical protein NWE85_01340 [Candidatus Bathyarchaeota archaeon]|nr:hypothetical protein [Candidatus Bathyarchaeota archaeon]
MSNMKRKSVLLLFSASLLCMAVMASVVAQDRLVGVSEGDWFRYGYFVAYCSSNDPNATFHPPGLARLRQTNETEWMLWSVQNVSSTEPPFPQWEAVFLEIVTHYSDGTENTASGYISVNFGSGIMVSKVISANLSAGDSVYSGIHYSDSKIIQTINRTYPDGARETNYRNRTRRVDVVRMNGETMNGTMDEIVHWYWDRATGVLVEYSSEIVMHIGNYTSTSSTSYRLIESNLWTVQEQSTWLTPIMILTILALITVTVSMLVYKRKHKSCYQDKLHPTKT